MSDAADVPTPRATPTVGVAVFSRADKRALEIGLRSLVDQSRAADKVLVCHQQTDARRPAYSVEEVTERVGVGETWNRVSADNVRNQALDRLKDHDLVLMMREGTVLAPAAIAAEVERFSNNRDLTAALLVSRRYVPQRLLPLYAMAIEPQQVIARHALTRPVRASRYHAPAILVVAPARGRPPRFEMFARRSEWAAGRLFLDGAARFGDVMEADCDSFGLIGGAPDRRGGFAQGQKCCDALLRLASANPDYRAFATTDIRRLFAEQSKALLFEPGRRTTRAFILGMLSRLRTEYALNRRLAADIRNLG